MHNMKAMLINAYGENSVFEAAEIEKPDVKGGATLVFGVSDIDAARSKLEARKRCEGAG